MGTARDKEFWLMFKVRPWFNCPWSGADCPDRVGCVSKDSCWRFECDKRSSLSELERKSVG